MKPIIFATSNPHKIREVNQILGNSFEIKGLDSINCTEEIPETSPTIAGNALQKARYVADTYNVDCFAEDTGLEIDALKGEPGVYSARYAGEQRSAEDNMNLVLEKMQGIEARTARFRTVVALILNGETHLFEGIAQGKITTEKQGVEGFGYDPIFVPNGYEKSFAQMSSSEKNKVSHRSKAIHKLNLFMNQLGNQGEK